MNKIIFTAIIIFISNSDIYCMKRKAEGILDISKPAKRIKLDNPAPHFIEQSITTGKPVITYVENEEFEEVIQKSLLCAIRSRDLDGVTENIKLKPKNCFLTYSIKEKFFEATSIILRDGQPTQDDLNASLNMAIGSQNKILTGDLLEKKAYLDPIKPVHDQVRHVLSNNTDIINRVAQYTKLSTAIELRLDALFIAIVNKGKITRDDIDESLKIALQEGDNKLFEILMEIKRSIFEFTNVSHAELK